MSASRASFFSAPLCSCLVPALDAQAVKMREVSDIVRNQDEVVDRCHCGDLAIGEWGRETGLREPGTLLAMPLRRSSVIR